MVSQHDRIILRDLAKRMAEIADLPCMAERKTLWKQHNSLRRVRPMVLVFAEGAWGELLPQSSLYCEGDEARGIEWFFRHHIYNYEHMDTDNVVEKEWNVHKVIRDTGWGIQPARHASTADRGSWSFDPVINEPADLKKITFPEVSYDEQATMQRLAEAQELFGDILDVKLRGITHISFHLMSQYTALRGLEQVMLDMYEEPEMLHDAMALLEEGHHRVVKQYDELNLFSLNNDGTYHSSGGYGYTDELPKAGFDPDHIHPCDMWSSAESQELAQVSPALHAEFVLPYEGRLLAPFALNGYGCCEDLTRKLDDVFSLPNMRRISISPWANVDACAEKLQGNYIFSWKPNPAYIVGDFDPEFIRADIQHTLDAAKGCVLEIILKDTHTCEFHPERFDIWTKIARELVEQVTV